MPVEESKLDNLLTKFWEISKIPQESDKNDEPGSSQNFRKPSDLTKQLVDTM